MVQFVASKPVNMNALEVFDVMSNLGSAVFSDLDADSFVVTLGDVELLVEGSGFTYTAGEPDAGDIVKITVTRDGKLRYVISDLDLDIPHFLGAEGMDPADIAASMFFFDTDSVFGSDGKDILLGFGGNDGLFGGAGDDKLYGGELNNTMYGGPGKDKLFGGDGLNVAAYDEKTKPVVVVLQGDEVAKVKVGGKVEDRLKDIDGIFGGLAADKLTGDALTNLLDGRAGKDIVKGKGGNDKLFGGSGADTLRGGPDQDELTGDVGPDKLFGDAGLDTFIFWSLGGNDIDAMPDFLPGVDTFQLWSSVFTELTTSGPLDPDFFASGAADDGDDYIIQSNRKVFYDADGDGPGEGVQFAKVAKGVVLGAADFEVFVV